MKVSLLLLAVLLVVNAPGQSKHEPDTSIKTIVEYVRGINIAAAGLVEKPDQVKYRNELQSALLKRWSIEEELVKTIVLLEEQADAGELRRLIDLHSGNKEKLFIELTLWK